MHNEDEGGIDLKGDLIRAWVGLAFCGQGGLHWRLCADLWGESEAAATHWWVWGGGTGRQQVQGNRGKYNRGVAGRGSAADCGWDNSISGMIQLAGSPGPPVSSEAPPRDSAGPRWGPAGRMQMKSEI